MYVHLFSNVRQTQKNPPDCWGVMVPRHIDNSQFFFSVLSHYHIVPTTTEFRHVTLTSHAHVKFRKDNHVAYIDIHKRRYKRGTPKFTVFLFVNLFFHIYAPDPTVKAHNSQVVSGSTFWNVPEAPNSLSSRALVINTNVCRTKHKTEAISSTWPLRSWLFFCALRSTYSLGAGSAHTCVSLIVTRYKCVYQTNRFSPRCATDRQASTSSLCICHPRAAKWHVVSFCEIYCSWHADHTIRFEKLMGQCARAHFFAKNSSNCILRAAVRSDPLSSLQGSADQYLDKKGGSGQGKRKGKVGRKRKTREEQERKRQGRGEKKKKKKKFICHEQ